jgi:ribosomal-protein-alanine N-acetyltransferase
MTAFPPSPPVRPMTEADLDRVREIEQAAYGTDAWSRRTFEDELVNGFSTYLVAEAPNGRVSAFAGVWFMRDQLHLVTIAVDPPFQRLGIAGALLLRCLALAEESELESVVLEVRDSNAGAQALYERFGFRRLGRLRRYYRDNDEDAIVMQTPDLADAEYQAVLGGLRDRFAARA